MCNESNCNHDPFGFSDLEDMDDFNSGGKAASHSVKSVEESIHHWSEKGNESAQGAIYEEKCKDCRGSGKFISWAGRVVGDCFKCDGTGVRKFRTSPEQRAKNKEAYAKRKEAKQNKASAKYLEWIKANEGMHEFLIKNADWSSFYRDMLERLRKGWDLTDNMVNAINKGMAKQAERNLKQAERTSKSPTVKQIVEAFDRAREAGLKRPRLVFGEIKLSQAAPNSRNPGMVYVKYNDDYAGKITVEGKFLPIRSCPAEVEKLVKELGEGDLLEKAKAYGIETGICCCCARELTDPESVRKGIGPICEGRWF